MTDAIVYAEDVAKGTAYQLGSYTVTEDELVEFATQWDPQAFHIDKNFADAGQFGGLIASGIQTLAIYQRLVVKEVFSQWSVIAGRSLRDVRFLRPVRPGDVLTGTVAIDDVEFDDRARALVTMTAELVNGEGKSVLSAVVDAYIRTRPHP